MAANDKLGQVNDIYILSQDQLGNKYQTRLNTFDNFKVTVNPDSTYAQLDSATRLLNSLTTNIYKDAIAITSISVNEKVMEEG